LRFGFFFFFFFSIFFCASYGVGDCAVHDAGYIQGIRRPQSTEMAPSLPFIHVTSSARFSRAIGRASAWKLGAGGDANRPFHRYEIKLNMIQLAEPKDRKLGNLLGTADLHRARRTLPTWKNAAIALSGLRAGWNCRHDGCGRASLRVRLKTRGGYNAPNTREFVRETFVARLRG